MLKRSATEQPKGFFEGDSRRVAIATFTDAKVNSLLFGPLIGYPPLLVTGRQRRSIDLVDLLISLLPERSPDQSGGINEWSASWLAFTDLPAEVVYWYFDRPRVVLHCKIFRVFTRKHLLSLISGMVFNYVDKTKSKKEERSQRCFRKSGAFTSGLHGTSCTVPIFWWIGGRNQHSSGSTA